jgi:hypothetical protein
VAKTPPVLPHSLNRPYLDEYIMADPHTVVGALVSAKACHVTNLAESTRRYGANRRAMLPRVVVMRQLSSLPPTLLEAVW